MAGDYAHVLIEKPAVAALNGAAIGAGADHVLMIWLLPPMKPFFLAGKSRNLLLWAYRH